LPAVRQLSVRSSVTATQRVLAPQWLQAITQHALAFYVFIGTRASVVRAQGRTL